MNSDFQPQSSAPKVHPSDDLKAFLDGELSFWPAWRVRAHLRGCAQCREELTMLQTITEELQSEEKSEERVPLAPELRAQILDAARQTVPPTPPVPVSQPAATFEPREPDTSEVQRRPSFWCPAFALAPLALCVVFAVLTLKGGKIKNTFNRAADSISITTDESEASRPAASAPSSTSGAASNDQISESAGIGGPVRVLPGFPGNSERRVQKQGSLTVAVGDVEASSDEAMRIVKEVGGFVANNALSSSGGRRAQLETRVPVEKFEEVVRVVGHFGNRHYPAICQHPGLSRCAEPRTCRSYRSTACPAGST
jgi:hypothetical protein